MAAVSRIPKNGRNKFHNYDYATEADVADAVRMELAKRFVLIVPCAVEAKEQDVGDKGQRVFTQKMRFTAHDGESGETISWDMYGQGSDSLDKGAFKSTTGAVKYAIMKLFLIPTGDDPERDDGNAGSTSTRPPPPEGMPALAAKMAKTPAEVAEQIRSRQPSSGPVFPNYGKTKGMPIRGAPKADLEFYLNGAKRNLADPSKARFHESEAQLAAAIESELNRQEGNE